MILVGYASTHGSTKGIAEAIGARLIQAGFAAEVRSIDEVSALDPYDAVVLGSAIHNSAWLAPAAAFVKSHAAALVVRPVWLFSVGSVGDTTSFLGPRATQFIQRRRKDTKELAGFRTAIRARDHRNFAGSVERAHWNFVGDLFLRALGGSYGDHRDWGDIDSWADAIARDLRSSNEARVRPHAAVESLH